MLALSTPRKPAPMLARGAVGLRLHVRPTAFGNALGSSIADAMSSPSAADNRTLLNQAERNADPDRYTTDNRMLLNQVERAADPDRYATDNRAMLNVVERAADPDRYTTDSRALLREAERAANPAYYTSRRGERYVVQSGDTWSGLSGNDLTRVGLWSAVNGRDLKAGQTIWLDDPTQFTDEAGAIFKQAGANLYTRDNSRLAALAREKFNFGDGLDARDIRESFAYRSRVSRELSDLQAQEAYQASAAGAPQMSASSGRISAPPLSAGERARLGSMEVQFGQNLAQGLVITAAASPPALVAQIGVEGYAFGSSLRNGEYGEAGIYAGLMGVDLLLAGGGSKVINALRSETQLARAELNSVMSGGLGRDLTPLTPMEGISPVPMRPKLDIPSYEELKDLAANSLDFGTKRDGALFWSGPGNMRFAQAYGAMTGRTTLEQTSGGQYLDSLDLFSNMSDTRQAAEIWDIASERMATQASGRVDAFLAGAQRESPYGGVRTWWRTEEPALQCNRDVTSINSWTWDR